MKTYKSESNIKPLDWDIQQTCVYHNYNIVETTRDDEEQSQVFIYDVDEYTLQEYSILQRQQISDLEDALLEIGGLIG